MIAVCRRFGTLNPKNRRLVLEAALLAIGVWTGLRLLQFQTLRRALGYYVISARVRDDRQPTSPEATVNQVAWAVTAVAAHLPVSLTCLVKALAVDAMLQRRGFDSVLRIGVREHSTPLQAHAWIEWNGKVVMGEIESLSHYAVLSAQDSP